MPGVFFRVFGVDKDVVKIDDTELVQVVIEDLVDVGLERGRGVGQSERKDTVFKVPVPGLEGRLPFVAFLNAYQVLRRADVQLGVHLRPDEAVEGLTDKRQGVTILNRNPVKAPVVDAES